FCIFKYNTVVRRLNMAVGDPHVFTVIWINAVAVCQAQVIEDPYSIDQHITASYKVSGPECTSLQSYIADRKVFNIFKKQQRDSRIKRSIDMPWRNCPVVNLFHAIDRS